MINICTVYFQLFVSWLHLYLYQHCIFVIGHCVLTVCTTFIIKRVLHLPFQFKQRKSEGYFDGCHYSNSTHQLLLLAEWHADVSGTQTLTTVLKTSSWMYAFHMIVVCYEDLFQCQLRVCCCHNNPSLIHMLVNYMQYAVSAKSTVYQHSVSVIFKK